MRAFLALLVLALMLATVAAFAQDPAAISAAEVACGPQSVNFDVSHDNSQHTIKQPEPGKALVYVIEDLGSVTCNGVCATERVGVDGQWVGALHRNSYLAFAVEPGERHFCANWQTNPEYVAMSVTLAHFTAEEGKVYYIRLKQTVSREQRRFDLDQLDSDQGKYLVASYPSSISHPKK
jgi:hypothetical protein